MLFFLELVCFSIVLYIFNVMIGISRVGEVFAHQLDALMVDHDHCFDGPFAAVSSVDDSLTPFLVQKNSNSAFVVVFSSTYENGFVMCLQKF